MHRPFKARTQNGYKSVERYYTTNAVLSAAGMNFRKLLNWIVAFLHNFYVNILFVIKELSMNSCLNLSEK